jgi:hypothetical protein
MEDVIAEYYETTAKKVFSAKRIVTENQFYTGDHYCSLDIITKQDNSRSRILNFYNINSTSVELLHSTCISKLERSADQKKPPRSALMREMRWLWRKITKI